MKAIITGLNGTVAPVLAVNLREAGYTITPWDRAVVPVDDPAVARAFLQREAPDCFFHIATGSPDWAELAARLCAEQGADFLFTSSVSVFAAAQRGPFTVEDEPQPDDDYGRYKLECERRTRAANPAAQIVRLGWQIGLTPGGNQMVDYLDRAFRADGELKASRHWYPACSFLADTADSLRRIRETMPPGLYHLDGNPGLNFYEIVEGLNRLLAQPWQVAPADEPRQNNRLLDSRTAVTSIAERLPPIA
jgi:dTDP-4-dehydrorhamnose reductase